MTHAEWIRRKVAALCDCPWRSVRVRAVKDTRRSTTHRHRWWGVGVLVPGRPRQVVFACRGLSARAALQDLAVNRFENHA